MFEAIGHQVIMALETNLVQIAWALNFIAKSALLVAFTAYLEKSAAPFFSNAQKHGLWLAVLTLVCVLPMSTLLSTTLLQELQTAPPLTLLTLLVPSHMVTHQSANAAMVSTTTGLLILIYVAGLLLLLTRIGISLVHTVTVYRQANFTMPDHVVQLLQKLKTEAGIKKPIRIGTNARCNSPVTFGTLQPVIILPSLTYCRDQEMLKNILVHELSHIKRYDHIAFIVSYCLVALNWFNPFAWLALRQAGINAEFACDDEVLKTNCQQTEFASQLLRIVRLGLVPAQHKLAGSTMVTRSDLSLRVENILQRKTALHTVNGHSSTTPLLAIVFAFIVMSAGNVFAIGNESEFASEDLRLIYLAMPEYPEVAARKGMTGFAQFSFSVNEFGRVDPTSIQLENSKPQNLFAETSIKALNDFVFAPRKVNGKLVATPNVFYTFNFDIRL